ncbi:MAG: hypothetical protein BVN31_06435 [Proteobacteria bacterium ST_bin15]|nr:MAG: hypothetical protein BVN31_06435 [Proteobacteria bacterium ST_bin15]
MKGVITETDTPITGKANHDIPVGHKVALKDMKKGDTIIKYGEDIGKVVADFKKGDHVHVHNHKTKALVRRVRYQFLFKTITVQGDKDG